MSTPPVSLGRKIWIGVRFVLFGFVGLCLMLISSFWFMAAVFAHHPKFPSPYLSLPLTVVGALMMLYAVGEWRRWAYLWVFLSIPISLCLLFLIPGTGSDKVLPPIVAAVAVFFSYTAVRVYYAPRARDTSREDGG